MLLRQEKVRDIYWYEFGKYLKDRLYSVIIYIFVIIAVILLMTAFKSQIELKITVGIIITLLWISEIFIDFFRKKSKGEL